MRDGERGQSEVQVGWAGGRVGGRRGGVAYSSASITLATIFPIWCRVYGGRFLPWCREGGWCFLPPAAAPSSARSVTPLHRGEADTVLLACAGGVRRGWRACR